MLKRRYEEAIAENNDRIIAANNLSRVSRLEKRATAEFRTWAGPRYKANTEAQKNFLARAASFSFTKERLEELSGSIGAKLHETATPR